MKFSSRRNSVLMMGKKEAGVNWKIGEEIMEEVEGFK